MMHPGSRRKSRSTAGSPTGRSGGGSRNRVLIEWPEWRTIVIPLFPLLVVLFGGATARFGQGLMLIALGTIIALAPPRVSAGRTINLILAGLLFLASTAFLPASWFPLPPWRAAFIDDFEIALPGTLSPQPILAAESLVFFIGGAAWFYLMVTCEWRASDRLLAGRIFAAGVIALAGLFLVLHKLDIMPPMWRNERRFGPFPNRNQTADFLAAAAIIIVACAQLRWRAKHPVEAFAWLLGLGVVLLALITSYSRAGIVMLFAEIAVYLLVEGYRSAARAKQANKTVSPSDQARTGLTLLNPRVRWLAISLSFLMVLLSLFLLFGGSTLDRLWPTSVHSTARAVTGDFRLRIQSDALDMIGASPWRGFGLGSFSEVFAVFRRRSAVAARAIHPESDYLWVAAELGWPGLLLVVAGLCWLGVRIVRSVRVSGTGNDRRLRLASALAVAAVATHGFVDVSGHRLGTMLSALFLAGLTLRGEPAAASPTAVPGGGRLAGSLPRVMPGPGRVAFRVLGVVLAAVGILFSCESIGWILMPGRVGVDALRAKAVPGVAARDYAGVERDMTRALSWAPLDWNLYFTRAGTRIYLGGQQDDISADFRRARYLEPFNGDLPLAEAKLWIAASEPTLAVSALSEAARREPTRTAFYIWEAMSAAGKNRLILDELARYTRRDPTMLTAFLSRSDTPDTAGYVVAALAEDPDLHRLDEPQKTTFLHAWTIFGDARALLTAMPRHPEWHTSGWRWWATALANNGQVEQACALVSERAPKPTLPPIVPTDLPLDEMQRLAALAPDDPTRALQAYRALGAAGNWSAAFMSLREVTTHPECPPYLHYLAAIAADKIGDWPQAWEAWNRYFAAAHIQSP